MDCSMPGLPVHHQCLELTQTHAYQGGDAINHLIMWLVIHVHVSAHIFSSVQSLSRVQLFLTHGPQHARPPVHHQLLELMMDREAWHAAVMGSQTVGHD